MSFHADSLILTQVYVKVSNIETGTEFEWPKDKFMTRYYDMKEMFQNFQEHDDWEVPLEKDPFYDDPESPTFIASANLFLQVTVVL